MVAAAIAGREEQAASTNPKTSSQREDGNDNNNNNHNGNTHLENPKGRPPLLGNNINNNGVHNNPRKPRSRQVPSRYLSPSPSTSTTTSTATTTTSSSCSSTTTSSRRLPSPLISRSTNSTPSLHSSAPKRSQSVDRRRPVANTRPMTPVPGCKPGNVGEALGVSAASKLLFTSTRSLSVSFQGEAFSLPISKAKAANIGSTVRKGTPERRKVTPLGGKTDSNGADHVENSRLLDQQRWPGRARKENPLSKSMDCSVDKKKLIGSDVIGRTLRESMIGESRRVSFDGRWSSDLGNAELLKTAEHTQDGNLASEFSVPSELTASDTDSVSSGSTSGIQEFGGGGGGGGGVDGRRSGPHGIVVSARFWQETNSRMRRLQDPGSPLSTSPGSRMIGPQKFVQSKRFSSDSPLSSPRTMPSPNWGALRPASPGKFLTPSVSSPSRISPSRVRNGMPGNLNGNTSSTPSILSFSVNLRRGKIGESCIVDAHLLRLLHNRHLQWRFVNARADAAFMVQKRIAEKNLWNAWITISELRRSVTVKRTKLQLLRQKLKLTSILKCQMTYLEEWALLDREHSSSLFGATEALNASILRLPIVGKTVVDIQSLKDAICSAFDVMQAMASSMGSLLSKVEEMNSLIAELVNVTAKEQALLGQCKDFLSGLAAMQVKDCSLKTHVIQLNRVPTTGSLTTLV